MAGPAERRVLPPPLAEWLAGWLVRASWAAGSAGLVWGWVTLYPPAAAAGPALHPARTGPAAGEQIPSLSQSPGAQPARPADGASRPRPATLTTSSRHPPAAGAGRPPRRPARGGRPPQSDRRHHVPPTVPPAPGTYAYTVSSGGDRSAATLTVTSAGTEAGQMLEDENWSTGGTSATRGTAWSPHAELLDWSDDGSGTCTYRPGAVWLRLPLYAGATWSGSTSCTYDGANGTVRVDESVAGRVVSAASTVVGGSRVFCWVVERDLLTTSETPGSRATSEVRTTDLFAPSLGLFVYETGRSAVPAADGTVDSRTWAAELTGWSNE